jgi:glycyl-tRNA synthetase beta chain
MSQELLLELGCEEIPARFLGPSLTQLREKGTKMLADARITHGEIKTFGTPRRLALSIADVVEMQQAGEERRVGPFVNKAFNDKGEPTQAATGFARSCGVALAELGREETPKGQKLLYVKKIEGRPSRVVLAELLPALLKSLEFQKAMRWGEGTMSFVRPIHWVVALLGGELIEFNLDGIASGRESRGQRFTHPGAFTVSGTAGYLAGLRERNVVVDPAERSRIIADQIAKTAAALGGEIIPDPGLLDEVTNLVEFPVVIGGKFDPRFLHLPPEVPIAAMRTHQRYFAVRKPGADRELLPCFITVANTPAKDMGLVARGNERVLAARLTDAEFYWKEDLQTGIAKMREGTAGMVFYKTLGSYLDKTGRVEQLCGRMASALFPGDSRHQADAAEGARYCKADLVSMMVGEFPELQGLMGGEYAKAGGLAPGAAAAIRDHYLPRSADDIAQGKYPLSPAGDVLALADKLDSVCACWSAGLAPTGAGDPFALRRQAQGIINLILTRRYRLNLPELIEAALANVATITAKAAPPSDAKKMTAEIVDFMLGRLRVQLLEAGARYDVVDACLAVWNGDLTDTLRKIEAVGRMRARPDFNDLMIAFRRVMNIVEGQPGRADTNLFQDQSEAVLYSEYTRIQLRVEPALAEGDYDKALEQMAGIKPAVDRFFDQVMVNVEDPQVRRNRQALCDMVARVFKTVADFSKIVIEGDK